MEKQAKLSHHCHDIPISWHILVYRDVLILGVVDAATCLLAGFAIFSILGYLAYNQQKDVEEVIKEGNISFDNSLLGIYINYFHYRSHKKSL